MGYAPPTGGFGTGPGEFGVGGSGAGGPAPEEGARVRRRTGWVRRGWTPRRPYYRIVNPVTQAEKFDPTATTSVTGSPSSPSAGPGDLRPLAGQPRDLEAAGVRLGRDCPHPIVDHTTARNHALARSQEATSRRS
jgi:hypothetical protein